MRLTRLTISLMLVGMATFYLMANYKVHPWPSMYFIWDKLKDLMLVLSLYSVLKESTLKRVLVPLALFCGLRIVWELLILFRSYSSLSRPTVVLTLFVVTLVSMAMVLLRDRNQNKQ